MTLRIRLLCGEKQEKHWDKRQDALGIPTNVDILEMHEIVFMEKFKQLGQHYQWIPKDAIGMTPTNDFYWVEQSTLIELKSVRKVRYAKIASEIRQAAVRAATNEYKPTIKDSFIVDLGEVRLTEKLTHQLEEYNIRSTQGNIKRLWVYSQGEIIEIALKKK